MTVWWKEQRKALLDPRNVERATFDNPMNYDRHLDVSGISNIISEPAIVERFQNLIGPDILCWRTEFLPKNPGDSGLECFLRSTSCHWNRRWANSI